MQKRMYICTSLFSIFHTFLFYHLYLKGIFTHNKRKSENYSDKNIYKEKSYLNYSFKDPKYSYEKNFERIRKQLFRKFITILCNSVIQFLIIALV